MLKYLTGDATDPVGPKPQIILHCVNDVGAWGAGFVLAISKRWPHVEAAYREWFNFNWNESVLGGCTGALDLGAVQFVNADNHWVANMVGQHGIGKGKNGPPVRYDAIQKGLKRVREFARDNKAAGISCPRFGSGLAGGDFYIIEGLIKLELTDYGLDVTVYDLPKKK